MKAILVSMLLAIASPASMMQRAYAAVTLPDPVVPVTLGQSVVALTGPWKFHIGDDPRWSDPKFDDSTWEPYDLASGIRNLTPEQALRLNEFPGWQHHGHPRYAGYGWYRIQLRIQPDAGPLALFMPRHVEDAYAVYLNGHLIGKFGKLDGFRMTYLSQPEFFPIPPGIVNTDQSNTLAIRFWSMPWEALPRRPDIFGGIRSLPLFGSSELLRVFKESLVYDLPLQPPLPLVLDAVAGLVSIFLFLFSRKQREYLWAGVALCSWALVGAMGTLEHTQQTYLSYQLSITVAWIGSFTGMFAMPLAAMYLLGVPRKVWKGANCFVSLLNLAREVVSLGIILGFVPCTDTVDSIDRFLKVTASVLGCLLVLIAIDGLRAIGRKAWLPIAPGLLFGARNVFHTLIDRAFVTLSPAMVHLLMIGIQILDICFAPSVLIIFLLRFARQQRENGRLLEDMRQAREVQRLLIPEKIPQISGWTIESEYRPAREVGGDFFQIIPDRRDGGLLIVAGDVTGKGLQAGMLVAMLVGAIRTESGHTSDPIEILGALNSRLYGREHGQATCLAIRIASDGHTILANAGHLPPYLNGESIDMEGSLPLGMIEDAQPSVTGFRLSLNDRLVLVSDGIVEATNAEGALFGFERLQSLLRTAKSASEVVSAAQRFGQEDDISVIAVTHAGAAVPAPA